MLLVIYRKQAVANANMAKTRTKKAGKVATRRLKMAKKKMVEKDKAGYYDELLKALWGYLSDTITSVWPSGISIFRERIMGSIS